MIDAKNSEAVAEANAAAVKAKKGGAKPMKKRAAMVVRKVKKAMAKGRGKK